VIGVISILMVILANGLKGRTAELATVKAIRAGTKFRPGQ